MAVPPAVTNDSGSSFIKDNQEAFNYGSLEEFGRRNDQFRDGMFRFEKRMK